MKERTLLYLLHIPSIRLALQVHPSPETLSLPPWYLHALSHPATLPKPSDTDYMYPQEMVSVASVVCPDMQVFDYLIFCVRISSFDMTRTRSTVLRIIWQHPDRQREIRGVSSTWAL